MYYCQSQVSDEQDLFWSEGGMIQLEALIELKFISSSFSSLSSY